MLKCRLHFVILLLAIWLIISIGSVTAVPNTIVIRPGEEVIKSVDSGVDCVSICGNVSVLNGSLDFWATSPSGKVLFSYNRITFTNFNISTTENGSYTFHLRNAFSQNNVTAILNYGRNFVVVLQENIHTWQTITTWTTMMTTTTPTFTWIEFMEQYLIEIVRGVAVTVISTLIVALLLDYLREKRQKWKDGPSKTPVVTVKPPL